jgi:hypothetical protein
MCVNFQNEKIMKTMKQLLIVIAFLSCSTMVGATKYQLHQTSSATYRSIDASGKIYLNPGWEYMHGKPMSSPNVKIYTTNPSVSFRSTSVMPMANTSLPKVENLLEIGSNQPNHMGGPRRVIGEDDEEDKPENWEDPGLPLTDVLPCLLLLVAIYALFVAKKKNRQTQLG